MDPLPVLVDEFQRPTQIDEVEFKQHQDRLKKELYQEVGIVGRGVEGVGWDRTQHDDGKPRPHGETGEHGDSGEEWDVLS